MKILITGAAGFVGARLARALLARGTLDGGVLERLVLADQFPLPGDLAARPGVDARIGTLLDQVAQWRHEPFDAVFHLASAVSGECEADFDLGMRSNLASTMALLDAMRGWQAAGAAPARLVFASSIAVFGPDPAHPFPEIVDDGTLPTPQTSYGTQKLICEHLIADYTRKGFIDGRAARLVTVTVRPGRPNGAASSFFSGIIREPLAGEEAVLPVDLDVRHPVATVQRMVDGLIAVHEASREAFVGRTAMTLPGLNVSVREMLQALEDVAGRAVRARVRQVPDATIAGIVSRWPRGVSTPRAQALGLSADPDFASIIRAYIADAEVSNPAALKGLA